MEPLKYQHSKVSLAVDCLLFTVEDERLKVLLVRRAEQPYKEKLALPGVAVGEKETLSEAARRCLMEETGITEKIYMEQLYTWGDDCLRDPRGRVISVSYYALLPRQILKENKGERVLEVKFYDVDQLLKEDTEMAFDHKMILNYGRERIKNKTQYSDIAFHLVDQEFTLPQLQKIYEILLGKKLFKANFRTSIKEMVTDTGKMKREGACRPSRIYRRREEDGESNELY